MRLAAGPREAVLVGVAGGRRVRRVFGEVARAMLKVRHGRPDSLTSDEAVALGLQLLRLAGGPEPYG